MNLNETLNERGNNYGPFSGHAKAAQDLKATIHSNLKKNERFGRLSDKDQAVVTEALDMIAHKIGRLVNGDPTHDDSWLDIGGYAELPRRFLTKNAITKEEIAASRAVTTKLDNRQFGEDK